MQKTENERVRELRTALHLTLEEFGKKLGVTKVAISNIEKGNRNVTKQMRKAICWAFGVNESWLVTGEGNMLIKEDIKQLDAFPEYLNSLGFSIEENVTEWHYENPDAPDPVDRNPVIDDEEYILSRNGQTAVFTAEEYEHLQISTKEMIEGQFYKKVLH